MRRSAIAAGLALMILAGGWTALWAYGAREAGRQLDAWMAAEAAVGRDWTCADRQIGGYPFALRMSCAHPTFRGQALGESVTASVAALDASVDVLHPTRLVAALAPPFSYRSADGTVDLRGRWSALRVDLDGLPDIETAGLAGADVVVAGMFGPAGRQSLSSTRLAGSFVLPKPGPNPTLGFDIAVAGTDLPQIDELVGDTRPSDLAFKGELRQADAGDARTPEEAMERWRQAGGTITLTEAAMTRDAAVAAGRGMLGLDAAHRATGHLDTEFVGLAPILRRYGINPNLVAAGGFLSHLLGGGNAKPPTRPGAISLPVNLRDGHLFVGPIQTSVELLPVY